MGGQRVEAMQARLGDYTAAATTLEAATENQVQWKTTDKNIAEAAAESSQFQPQLISPLDRSDTHQGTTAPAPRDGISARTDDTFSFSASGGSALTPPASRRPCRTRRPRRRRAGPPRRCLRGDAIVCWVG